MSNHQKRVKEIFDEAMERPAEERVAFLNDACGTDSGLLDEVKTLLLAYDDAGGFLTDRAPAQEPGEEAGETIGRYKLLQQIGEGGFGVVWMAEQSEPVRRKVALKIIKLGMDTRRVVARFEAEQQALALMDHPNIAKVFDGGTTPSGRPYFVMDLVKGLPITEFCDQSGLSPKERIDLMRTVCHAVQHAHHKGVIHRDLKPSNILVSLHDGAPVPKVIDFGIAKATNHQLTQKTLFTDFRQLIGTPEYMSPEQAEFSGLDIDTRSDVYSLGVILYELLTGTKPFDFATKGYEEILRQIREVPPPKPSTRISTLGDRAEWVAKRRQLDPHRLGRIARGELDWIVMKALEKERKRRYATANALAEDLGRYLEGLAVEAGPPSSIYRLRHFARRHKAMVSIAGLAVSFLVVFAVAMAIQAERIADEAARANREAAEAAEQRDRANREATEAAEQRDRANREATEAAEQRDRANREAETARQVSQFLESLFQVADRSRNQGQELTAREMLDRGAKRIDSELAEQPVVRARLLETMGKVYRGLGLVDEGIDCLGRALEIRRTLDSGPNEELASAMSALGAVMQDSGRLDEAAQLYRESLDMRRELHGPVHVQVAGALNDLGLLLQDRGDLVEAEETLRDALQQRRDLLGNDSSQVAGTLSNLGINLKLQGRHAEAEAPLREGLDIARAVLGREHPNTDAMANNLSNLLRRLGKLDEAEVLRRESLALARKLHGDDHPRVATNLNNLGSLLRSKGDYVEGEQAHREALEIFKRKLGDDHPGVATITANLAGALHQQGRLEEADELAQEALERFRSLFGERHQDVIQTLCDLGAIAHDREQFERAAGLYEEAVIVGRDVVGSESALLGRALVGVGMVRLDQDRMAEAGPLLTEGIAILRKQLPDDHTQIARAESALGAQRCATGQFDEAEALLLHAHEALAGQKAATKAAAKARGRLVELYEKWGKPEDAAKWREQ